MEHSFFDYLVNPVSEDDPTLSSIVMLREWKRSHFDDAQLLALRKILNEKIRSRDFNTPITIGEINCLIGGDYWSMCSPTPLSTSVILRELNVAKLNKWIEQCVNSLYNEVYSILLPTNIENYIQTNWLDEIQDFPCMVTVTYPSILAPPHHQEQAGYLCQQIAAALLLLNTDECRLP